MSEIRNWATVFLGLFRASTTIPQTTRGNASGDAPRSCSLIDGPTSRPSQRQCRDSAARELRGEESLDVSDRHGVRDAQTGTGAVLSDPDLLLVSYVSHERDAFSLNWSRNMSWVTEICSECH